MKTREQVLREWVAALRSGKYRQAKLDLKGNDSRSFCCLGVLCDLARKDGGPKWERKHGEWSFMGRTGELPSKIRKWIGLSPVSQQVLIDMNDDQGKRFRQIADYIEKTYLGAK